MPILHVRNVPEDLYERLRRRAARSQRSLSAEVMSILEVALKHDPEATADLLARMERRRSRLRMPGPGEPSSLDLLHEGRAR